MEHQKISNLLNEANDFKFVTRKWSTFYDQSNANYDAGNEITFDIFEIVKFDICDYNDAYILVRGDIQLLQPRYNFKNVHHLLNASRKLMEQQHMNI